MSLRERIRDRTEQLGEALLSSTPAPKTRQGTGDYAYYTLSGETSRIGPDQADLEKYWQQYRLCPLVRVSINTFAEDVTAPGYRVRADDDELVAELKQWLANAAIVGGESHRDFAEILRGAIVHEQVRGTALVEKVAVDGSPEETWGFRLVNPSTVEAYTYDSKAVLIRPDDTDVAGVQQTPTGEAAAYGQWGDGALAGPFNEETVYLSQDDVIKLINDPDTADIFGNSTIEPVSTEIDELYRMLDDVGEAIHSKGYPLWVFYLGEPNGDSQNPRAGVWPEEEMQNYRDGHKNGNWSTNQKDFVPGDVDVDRIEGEVPEIEELLDWYVQEIMASMPIPLYKLGSHANDINRDITSEQSPQYERRVKAKRRRLQNAFTPVLKEKARQLGYGDELVSSVELSIEEERESNPLKRDDFSPSEFAEFAQGLKAAGGGDATAVVEPDEMRGLLGLPERDGDDDSLAESSLDEAHPEVQAQFEELYGEPAVPDELDDGDDVELDTSQESDAEAPAAD